MTSSGSPITLKPFDARIQSNANQLEAVVAASIIQPSYSQDPWPTLSDSARLKSITYDNRHFERETSEAKSFALCTNMRNEMETGNSY